MTSVADNRLVAGTVYNYHLLRSALEQFGKTPLQLNPLQVKQAHKQAEATFKLETRVLASAEAREVVVPQQHIDAAVNQVAKRYPDWDEFQEDLHANHLTTEVLRHALQRELRFDAVMERVGAEHAEVSELDIDLFYEAHRERFTKPETRTARHILITINPQFPENKRNAVISRIKEIEKLLQKEPTCFAELARQYSECPSAMEGGKLGRLPKGKLYPELDQALFELEEGGISGPLESELGMHLLHCEKIHPSSLMPLTQVRVRIREIMEKRKKLQYQRAWLAGLPKGERLLT